MNRSDHTPKALIAERLEGESFDDYKKRRRQSNRLLNQYASGGATVDSTRPSLRLLHKLVDGKRSINSLRGMELHHLIAVVGIYDVEQLQQIVEEAQRGEGSEIGSDDFWDLMRENRVERRKQAIIKRKANAKLTATG